MWQATHYNNTYQTQNITSGNGLFATPANSPTTAGTPLKPFYQADGKFHTSKTVASTKAFGYTYPEINDWSQNTDETRRSVVSQINQLYGDDAAERASRIAATSSSWAWARPTWKEYYAQVRVERSELPLPCSINLLLGDALAGQTSVLSMPTSGRTHAEVPLTRALRQIYGRLDAATVIPSLQKSLRIEIRKVRLTLPSPPLPTPKPRRAHDPPSTQAERARKPRWRVSLPARTRGALCNEENPRVSVAM